jgi:nucleoside-diphosphate-sugar epimerase
LSEDGLFDMQYSNVKRILLTGASGFVGGAVAKQLLRIDSVDLLLAGRRCVPELIPRSVFVPVAEINSATDWVAALVDVEVVVHCAARVHVMNEAASDPLAEFREVNVAGTLNLARQAMATGVKRFIFISSVKVNGEGSEPGRPFTPEDTPAPVDAYGISKMEAEQGLLTLAAETGMEVVIIRPTLIYGPGVKANFLSMMSWLHKAVPLPFGAIYNQRSLVALDNLVDLIVTCIVNPAAANQTFLVSDGEDLSTTELLRRMGVALGKPARLLGVPSWLLEAVAAVLGKKALAQRLCGSLQVDISKTRELLNWSPPVSVDEALRKTAKHFLEQQAQ